MHRPVDVTLHCFTQTHGYPKYSFCCRHPPASVIVTLCLFSPMVAVVRIAVHQRKFEEAIPVNLTLVVKSARCRSPHAWPGVPPLHFKEVRDIRDLEKPECIRLSAWQLDWHYPLPPVRPLKSCRFLPIPALDYLKVGRIQSGPSSSTIPLWVSRQELEHQEHRSWEPF